VVEQVLLADVGDVGRVLVLSEQVVERLIAARAHLLGDGLVPFLAVGEDRVDVEHDAAEVEQLVAYDVADREARLRVSRSLDPPASLRRIELRPFHDVTRYGYTQGKARFRRVQSPAGACPGGEPPGKCSDGLGKRASLR